MALEILYKGSRGKGKYTGKRELTSQREIKTCFRLAFAVGSQFDFFVTAIASFKMIYAREEEGKEGDERREGGGGMTMNMSMWVEWQMVKNSLAQGPPNLFCKGPESKYFRRCGEHGPSCNYSNHSCRVQATIGSM